MTNKKTIYELFKDFADFWTQLKPRLVKDFRTKDHINFIFFSNRIYDYYKHDTYYGTSEEALNRIFTQIAFDCAEFSKKEAIYANIYEKTDKLLRYSTKTEEKGWTETTVTPKTITNQSKPIYSAQDLVEDSHGYHNRADWLETVQKQTNHTSLTKEGIKVADKDGKAKTIPNYVEVYTQDNAGLARLLGVFSNIDIDLTKYLSRYRKFFYSSYGMEGELVQIPGTRRYSFKSYEQMEEEEEKKEEKKTKIDTGESEISYAEWKKEFKKEKPDQNPTYQLYTVYRLEKRKTELDKELKKTSGVFRDKINLRLTFTESLIEGFKKEITTPSVGKKEEKLSLEASDEERKTATFWARINQVVGFAEFKRVFADFVDGYNDLVQEGLSDKIPSQMYLLLGPPGVGKSYISTIIAESIDWPIEIISMNGKKDTSVFFGVPQEWAGAGCGEILKAMIKHKSRSLIVLLDELEKCDKQVQQVLGNLTDKSLNKKFKDVFFDFPVPVNEVVWFCTANYPEQIEPFIYSRLTPIQIKPLSYEERLQIAQDLVNYNFASYKISNLASKFSLELIRKCLCKEWGVRGLKDNIERISYKVFLLNKRNNLPDGWDTYAWPIVDKEETDTTCPYAKDRNKNHKEICECFKPELIDGWEENMTA